MNVIISNKNQLLLENLGIDVIKEMNGEFDVDEIISTFQNMFYQRMILDITAIKNYTDITKLQKLSISLNMEKVILLLDGTDATSNPAFISNLISMGIYNFAKNVEGIQYLYNTPNTYRDVAQFHQIGNTQQNQESTTQVDSYTKSEVSKPIVSSDTSSKARVIGVKNLTKQSGATSLVYMMKNELSKRYKVIAIEVDKNDFIYFRDNGMISAITSDIGGLISRYNNYDVILIDINNSMVAEGFCEDVLYLIEPSIIKLQKLMALNAASLQNLKNKKVVLNKSLLTQSEVSGFEYEARIKVFYSLPPLNDRSKNIDELKPLLKKLGFDL